MLSQAWMWHCLSSRGRNFEVKHLQVPFPTNPDLPRPWHLTEKTGASPFQGKSCGWTLILGQTTSFQDPNALNMRWRGLWGIIHGSRSYPPSYPQLVLPVSTDCSSELYSEPATSLKTFPLFKGNIITMKGSTSKRGFVFFLNLHIWQRSSFAFML